MTGRPGIATRLGERQAEPDRCGLAIAMILLASLSFSLVAVMVRLSGDVPLYEKVFFRGVVMVAAMAAIAVRRRENPFAVTPRVHLLLLRSAFGTAAMFLYFFAIEHLALADAAVLNNLSPFFVAIFAVVFLKERLMRYTVPVLLLAFAGAMFVVKPKFSLEVVPAIAGLLSAAGSGAAYTLVRFLRGYEPPYRIVMYFSVVSVIVALPPMLGNFVMPEGTQWIYLLGAGVFATMFAQYHLDTLADLGFGRIVQFHQVDHQVDTVIQPDDSLHARHIISISNRREANIIQRNRSYLARMRTLIRFHRALMTGRADQVRAWREEFFTAVGAARPFQAVAASPCPVPDRAGECIQPDKLFGELFAHSYQPFRTTPTTSSEWWVP